MSTKKLARQLGLIRKHSQSSSAQHKSAPKQLFSYLIIIDFESTCWREKNNYGQEIIEFPAVLLNMSNGEIESEFHSYVQPQEHPVLSEFCTELTGITQNQVEAGLPLAVCLCSFKRWLQCLQQQRGVVFVTDRASPAPSVPLCTFVTWSDWDLGVCLLYECKRKQISKPEAFNSWIDLRATYRVFYNRKPKGLNGALQDLGIEFLGREHSGLDDARNTARLAWRMIMDGCALRVTKSLSRAPLISRPPPNLRTTGTREERRDAPTGQKEKPPTTVAECRSLVLPRTVLAAVAAPRLRTTLDSAPMHPPISTATSDRSVDSLANQDWPKEEEEKETVLFLEDGKSGSYDDVVLEEGDGVHPEDQSSSIYTPYNLAPSFARFEDVSRSSATMAMPRPRPSNPHPFKPRPSEPASTSIAPIIFGNLYRSLAHSRTSSIPLTIYRDQSDHASPLRVPTEEGGVFRAPPPVLSSCVNQSKHSFCLIKRSSNSSCLANQSTRSTTTVNQSALSVSSVKQKPLPSRRGGAKVTAPLCGCGRRTRRLTVGNGGPNHGRAFYTCAVRKGGAAGHAPHTGPAPHGGCSFFKWESALLQSALKQSSISNTISRSIR